MLYLVSLSIYIFFKDSFVVLFDYPIIFLSTFFKIFRIIRSRSDLAVRSIKSPKVSFLTFLTVIIQVYKSYCMLVQSING